MQRPLLKATFLAISLAVLACSAEDAMTPAIGPADFAGSLVLAGNVVRSDVDQPIAGVSYYLFAPTAAGTRGAQWIDHGAVAGFHTAQGFWAVPVASGRTDAEGAFRISSLRDGGYVLWVVPDVLKGCSRGALMSLRLSKSVETLLVRAS